MYASVGLGQYKNPLWTNRVGHVDWRGLFKNVMYDITIAGGDADLTSMPATRGGTILEAEDTAANGSEKAAGVGGYTGTGYLDFRGGGRERWVEWTFDAPEAGTYTLEVRYIYTMRWQDEYPANVTVNGKSAGDIVLWHSGGEATWAWDRRAVILRKGRNTIRLTAEAVVLIDHLNVLWGGSVCGA
jgi:hypothetical protein